ncbi:MAG: hypothetical protein DRN96_00705 [Thermoproteota archaeon]|nr:MAG: hypothetical protein DRN96_00705 [Candidatus Korarchaeota archaeon]RLG55730.1 MAG: hypothetical protein DRN99_01795 [Candidatus Korarchaeota archaeon]
MGGRRKKKRVIRRRPRRPKSIYPCPICQREGVIVKIDKKEGRAVVACMFCGFSDTTEVMPGEEKVDIYSRIVDKVTGQA